MTKETIPQEIIDKINKEYPEVKGLEWQDCHKKQREAAIWGYGLSEDRIKELEEQLEAYESGWMDKVAGHMRKVIDEDKSEKQKNNELDKWISVKDGLPENSEDVFGYNTEDDGYGICHYSHEDNMWRGSHIHDGLEGINITHYQYLPKPPKDI